jgi:hypothetical protein
MNDTNQQNGSVVGATVDVVNGSNDHDAPKAVNSSTVSNEIALIQTTDGVSFKGDVEATKRTDPDEGEIRRAAGIVFLEQITTEIAEESKQIEAEVKTMSDYLNRIELRFGEVNEVVGGFPIRNPFIPIVNALEGGAGNGSIYVISGSFSELIKQDENYLFVKCNNDPIPLAIMGKGIWKISNQTAGVFDDPTVHINVGKTIRIGLMETDCNDRAGESILVGEIEHLNDADRLALLSSEGQDGASALLRQYLVSGEGLRSPNAIFIPKYLVINKEDLSNFGFQSIVHPDDMKRPHHESNAFRQAIVKSIGTSKDMSRLLSNGALKNTRYETRLAIDSILLKYDEESITLMLSDGVRVPDFDSGEFTSVFFGRSSQFDAWVVRLPECPKCNRISYWSLQLFVSGIRIGAPGRSSSEIPAGFGHDGVYGHGSMLIIYEPYALVRGSIYICPETGEQSYELNEVAFWFNRIQETLTVLGIETV